MRLLRTEYKVEDGKPVVYLFQRENGKRVISTTSSFVPYFYIPADEIDKLSGIRADKQVYEAIDGTGLRKVYVSLPEDVPELREKFSKTYEADVLFATRALIDQVDSIELTEPKVLYLDIETDNKGRVPDTNKAEEPIICISAYTSDLYSTFIWRQDLSTGSQSRIFDNSLHEIHYYRTEEEMLKAFVDFFRNEEADVVTGWNLLRFDLKYLLNRMAVLCMDANKLSPIGSAYIRREDDIVIKGVALIDLYDAYRHYTFGEEESYKLDFIARKVTGFGKVDSENNIKWMWRNLDKLVDYNVNDVFLVKAVNDKLRLLEFMDELRRLCFCQLEDTLSASRMSDCYILRLFHNKKVFPTKTHHQRVSYQGAIVETWANGIRENVVAFDMKSLYPSLICSFNISPETLVESNNILHINNLTIDQSKKGFLPETIENLFRERAKYKVLMKGEEIGSELWQLYDTRQYALKTLLNALYGQTAYPNSRIYNPKVAETVTFLGRQIITWSKEFLEKLGYELLAVDTDSLFFSMKEIDLIEIENVLTLLNDSYSDFVKQYGLEKHILEMEFKKIYKRAFFGTKKRYAGAICYQDGKEVDRLEVVGFEIRRSDAAQFSRKLQSRIFDMLLRENRPKEEVLRYIGDEIDRIRKGDFTFTEIGIPKGINKSLSDYEHPSANIRGAIYAEKNLGIELSSKPKMLYISKMPNNLPQSNVLCFDEDGQVPAGTEIDTEKMLEKLIKDKISGIFEALNWKLSGLVPYWQGKPAREGEQLALLP